MGDIKQRRLSAWRSIIMTVGAVLFALSFCVPPGRAVFVPTLREHFGDYLQPFWGLRVFLQTPFVVFGVPLWRGAPIDNGLSPYEVFVRGVLFAAWLTNFTVFFRLRVIAALVSIALPWIAFICWFGLVARFVPFYFWALGIAFIHLSRIWRSWPDQLPDPTSPSVTPPAGAGGAPSVAADH
jgi:hypothetical protein